MSMLKLSIQNLSKNFGNLSVLNNISLYVKKGEFVCIIGQSGCGKSTLFNIIAGIESQSSGKVFLGGKEIQDRAGHAGYMMQSPLLLPWKTALDNIMLGPIIKHNDPEKTRKEATDLLKKFDLLSFANNYPHTLSGGMKQRVSLLRTILFKSDLLLLDEPFGQLDAITRMSLQLCLVNVWEKINASILFITHDVSEAILLSDRIYVFSSRPGRILKEVKVNLPRKDRQKHLIEKKGRELERDLLNQLLYE